MSHPEKTVAALFDPPPPQWGLRGDPYLWQELRRHFERTPLPPTAAELTTLLETAFETLTDHPLATPAPFFIERFAHGGMSSGHISPTFWRDEALPLLLARFA